MATFHRKDGCMDTDIDIDKIVSQTQRKVKHYSDKEDTSDLSNDLNWIENFLASDTTPKRRNEEVDNSLRRAKIGMDRRITDSDFRDRFSFEVSETSESRTEDSFKKALSKIARSYTRSIKLVE